MRRSPCDISTTLSANEPFLSIVSANEPFLSIVSTNEPFVDAREEVIQAWDMDDSNEDQRLPQSEPNEFVSLDKLARIIPHDYPYSSNFMFSSGPVWLFISFLQRTSLSYSK